jgi:hypothetical protein
MGAGEATFQERGSSKTAETARDRTAYAVSRPKNISTGRLLSPKIIIQNVGWRLGYE